MSPSSLDIENHDQLLSYLQNSGRIASSEMPATIVLNGGVSNRTVLVERKNGESWVLKQALAKLRVDVDWFSDPARIQREALGIKYLHELAPPGAIVPLIFEDASNDLLAMQAVPKPHDNFKSRLLAGQIDSSDIEQFGQLLGAIHHNAGQRRAELSPIFDDRSFFESLRLEPYYHYTADQVPQASQSLHDLIEQTRHRRLTLVHGDYSPKNILIRNDQLILLDHEVIHWGDPAFDLGFSLAHFLSKAHHLKTHRTKLAQAANLYWQTYLQQVETLPWEVELESFAVWHTSACLLARVAGRSKLEYLIQPERITQQRIACELLNSRPMSVADLIEQFLGAV